MSNVTVIKGVEDTRSTPLGQLASRIDNGIRKDVSNVVDTENDRVPVAAFGSSI